MKVILTMAISVNGIIAGKDGNEDFLSHDNWIQFVKLAHRVGCFVWGRKTYDAVLSWGGTYLDDLKDVRKIVLSRSPIVTKHGFTQVDSPENALKLLEKEGMFEVIITGGSTINSEFAKRGLIDEVIFDVNSVILGEGIPVFAPANFHMKLELLEVTKIGESVFEMRYKVLPSSRE